jgi:C_GCAxxG_C_C family probable redox protein
MTQPQKAPPADQIEELSRLIGRKAHGLFASGKMLCSPAVLAALNQGLGGGLDPELLLRLSGGLTQGLGGAGCLCGALSAATLALGLFLGNGKKSGRGARRLSSAAKELHDQFKAAQGLGFQMVSPEAPVTGQAALSPDPLRRRRPAGSTCCRVLTKKVKHDPKLHTAQCAALSGQAAEIAARLILTQRPELAPRADLNYLSAPEPRNNGFKKALSALGALGS